MDRIAHQQVTVAFLVQADADACGIRTEIDRIVANRDVIHCQVIGGAIAVWSSNADAVEVGGGIFLHDQVVLDHAALAGGDADGDASHVAQSVAANGDVGKGFRLAVSRIDGDAPTAWL